MRLKKETLNPTECIISGDFSENFTFVMQDEIQSFHWVNNQATLHPFVIYYIDGANNNELTSKSVCIISDHLQHSTTAVYAFQKVVLEFLKSIAPNVKKVIYFSDGAASQYKNKTIFTNLCHHFEDFNYSAEWHFFATSHGKGPCDGIGGTVKRIVTKTSLQRTLNNHIKTPKEMFEFCDENIIGIKFFYVNSETIQKEENYLTQRYDNAVAVPNTRSYHCFKPIDLNSMQVFKTSSSVLYDNKVLIAKTKTKSGHVIKVLT